MATKQEIQQKLLEMATNGNPKPTRYDEPYGRAIWTYTSRKSKSYDPDFRKKLVQLAPNWLISRKLRRTLLVKKKLVDLAVKKQPRPRYRDANNLGEKFVNYTEKLGRGYDAEFTQILKILAPHWFYNKTKDNKKILLELAKSGGDKPLHQKKGIGRSFARYVHPLSKSYDRKFKEEIEKYAPHWLIRSSEANKQALIQMGLNKEKRPTAKHPLGRKLSSYISPSSESYDHIFVAKIKIIAPEWLKS